MKELTLKEILDAKKALEREVNTLLRQFESNYPVKIYNIYYMPGDIDLSTNERNKTVQISLDI